MKDSVQSRYLQAVWGRKGTVNATPGVDFIREAPLLDIVVDEPARPLTVSLLPTGQVIIDLQVMCGGEQRRESFTIAGFVQRSFVASHVIVTCRADDTVIAPVDVVAFATWDTSNITEPAPTALEGVSSSVAAGVPFVIPAVWRRNLHIRNTGVANPMDVLFPGGSVFTTLVPGAECTISDFRGAITLSSAVGTFADWQSWGA